MLCVISFLFHAALEGCVRRVVYFGGPSQSKDRSGGGTCCNGAISCRTPMVHFKPEVVLLGLLSASALIGALFALVF